jgi:hypothetical protein
VKSDAQTPAQSDFQSEPIEIRYAISASSNSHSNPPDRWNMPFLLRLDTSFSTASYNSYFRADWPSVIEKYP